MAQQAERARQRLALRRRLRAAQAQQRQLLELRDWMRARGLAHDLEFLSGTDPMVDWLAVEIAAVQAALATRSS